MLSLVSQMVPAVGISNDNDIPFFAWGSPHMSHVSPIFQLLADEKLNSPREKLTSRPAGSQILWKKSQWGGLVVRSLPATIQFYLCIADTERHSFYHEKPSTNRTKNKKQELRVGTNCATRTPICIAGTIITLRRAQALGHPTGFQSLVYKVFWFAAVWLLWHFKRGRFERMLLLRTSGLGNGYWKITQENRQALSLFFPPYIWMTSVLGKGAPGTDPETNALEGRSREQVKPQKWSCALIYHARASRIWSGGTKLWR